MELPPIRCVMIRRPQGKGPAAPDVSSSPWVTRHLPPVSERFDQLNSRAAQERVQVEKLESRPRWNSKLPSVAPHTARLPASMMPLPPLVAAATGRPSRAVTGDARQQVLLDLRRFDDRLPYDEAEDDEDERTIAHFTAAQRKQGTSTSTAFSRMQPAVAEKLQNPLCGLLVNTPTTYIAATYRSVVESDRVRQRGMSIDDFRQLLQALLPGFQLSRELLHRVFCRYARLGGVEGDTVMFDTFLVQFATETSSADTEDNVKYFFESVGGGMDTVSAEYLTCRGLRTHIEKRIPKAVAAHALWCALADTLLKRSADVMWALSRFVTAGSTSDFAVDAASISTPRRSAIQVRLQGAEPPPPLPRVTLHQLRFVLYTVPDLCDGLRGLWYPTRATF